MMGNELEKKRGQPFFFSGGPGVQKEVFPGIVLLYIW